MKIFVAKYHVKYIMVPLPLFCFLMTAIPFIWYVARVALQTNSSRQSGGQ